MMRRLSRLTKHSRADERGSEAVAMIIVLPFLFVLIMGLVDISLMLKTRMVVENITRDAVRHAAADGGNYNPRTHPAATPNWDDVALAALWNGGKCTQSQCAHAPTVDCTKITTPSGTTYHANVATSAGDIITCSVDYASQPINGALLNQPVLGMGIGSMLKPFHIEVSARSETGYTG